MPFLINLSTIHRYSFDETVAEFVAICKKYDKSLCKCLFSSFPMANEAWLKWKLNYGGGQALINSYKLGAINTDQFLIGLGKIFSFLEDSIKEKGNLTQKDIINNILIEAWNISIQPSDELYRLQRLIELAKKEPVYIISNTNPLNMQAVLSLLKEHYPHLKFKNLDQIKANSQQEVEILPNIFVYTSYQHGAFKDNSQGTPGLIAHLSQKFAEQSVTLVSQYQKDRNTGLSLKFNICDVKEFYEPSVSLQDKKNL